MECTWPKCLEPGSRTKSVRDSDVLLALQSALKKLQFKISEHIECFDVGIRLEGV